MAAFALIGFLFFTNCFHDAVLADQSQNLWDLMIKSVKDMLHNSYQVNFKKLSYVCRERSAGTNRIQLVHSPLHATTLAFDMVSLEISHTPLRRTALKEIFTRYFIFQTQFHNDIKMLVYLTEFSRILLSSHLNIIRSVYSIFQCSVDPGASCGTSRIVPRK